MTKTIEFIDKPTKRLFGLKTVALAFEYGALLGVVTGGVGGSILARTYHSDELSRVEKAQKLGKLSLYTISGIGTFMGLVHLVCKIKIKG